MYEKDLAAKDTKVFCYGKLNQLRIWSIYTALVILDTELPEIARKKCFYRIKRL